VKGNLPWVRIPLPPLLLAGFAPSPRSRPSPSGSLAQATNAPSRFESACKTCAMQHEQSFAQAMRVALDEAHAALGHGDVPVGAVVLRDGVIIAARHNERELTGDPTAHAEILALRDAAATVGRWRLDDCTLVVTLEPCAMCAGAMVNGRLGRLVYGADDPKAGAAGSRLDLVDGALLNHRVPITTGVLADECGRLLVDFFTARRGSAIERPPPQR
jgi:tRNA(adenine34) deaminase